MAAICKGTVLTTKQACTKLAILNGLCGRHQEQIFVLEAKEKGETVCRQFDRGCRNYLSVEDKAAKVVTCKVCRDKFVGKETPCEHIGCKSKTEGNNRFCGKHIRDSYREDQANKGIRYCNIDRGCASILKEGEKICDHCNGSIKQKIIKQLSDLRNVEKNCLKCLTVPKSNGYFCDTCYPSIRFVDSKSKRDINNMWNDVYKGAIERNMLILLPYTTFSEIIIRPCFYCGQVSEEGFNSIDRYDNAKGYIISNIKPCCTHCNMMKHDMPAQAFLDKVNSIVKFCETSNKINDAVIDKWKEIFTTKYISPYYTYKSNAEGRRSIKFNLSIDLFNRLKEGACYLCGIKTSDLHKNGIDRLDNTKGYTVENSRTCCTHCNLMKNDSVLSEFIEHCKNIKNYCSLLKESIISHETTTRLVKQKDLYRSADIYEFIDENTLAHFCSWAKEAGKTAQFIQGIREISEKKLKKEEALLEIQHQMDMERLRTYKLRDEDHVVKHYSAASVHAMLLNGEAAKFQDWYEKTFGLSEEFEEQLAIVLESILALSSEDGISLCKKFMKAENGRRTSIHKNAVKQTMKETTKKRANWIAKVIVPTPDNVIEHVIVDQSTTIPIEYITHSMPEQNKQDHHIQPKQWKAIDIYRTIKSGKSEYYKTYCESYNDLKDLEAWSVQWVELQTKVLEAQNFEAVKEFISNFIVELRKHRHTKLLNTTKPSVLDREDRIVWPKETVHKAFIEGRLEKFKQFNEANGEAGLHWDARWKEFISALEATADETDQLEIIRKFQVNVRVSRYRCKNRK